MVAQMTLSSFSFKNKLGLVALLILASQLICNGAEAMVLDAPASPGRKTDDRNNEISQKSKSIEHEKEENLFQKYKPLTRRERKDLLKKADEEEDLNAQNEVIDRIYTSLLEPLEYIEHLTLWKNSIERCYLDDRYAHSAILLIINNNTVGKYSSWINKIAKDTLFNNIIARANQGNADAQFNLGGMYESGCGVFQNDNSAFDLYTLAANQGHAMAQFYLAVMYINSEVVKKDSKKALNLLTLSANRGNIIAQNSLGQSYLFGEFDSLPENKKMAFFWYTLAGDQGNTDAQRRLGLGFKEDEWVDKDRGQAFYWLTMSQERSQEIDTFLRSQITFPILDKDHDEEESLKNIQNEFTHILTGKKLSWGESPTSGLHYLVHKYQLKAMSNRQRGFNPLALSDLGQKDEYIAEKLVTFLIALEGFREKYNKKAPGFMVAPTGVTDYLEIASLPFLSSCFLTDRGYISLGESNVTLGDELITCLETVDELCGALQDKSKLYKIGLEHGLADLMNKQTYLQICKEDKNRADEFLKKSKKFLQQQKDYEKLKSLYTKEISEIEVKDIPIVQEAAKKTKDLISRFSLRNKWFTDEYEVFQ